MYHNLSNNFQDWF